MTELEIKALFAKLNRTKSVDKVDAILADILKCKKKHKKMLMQVLANEKIAANFGRKLIEIKRKYGGGDDDLNLGDITLEETEIPSDEKYLVNLLKHKYAILAIENINNGYAHEIRLYTNDGIFTPQNIKSIQDKNIDDNISNFTTFLNDIIEAYSELKLKSKDNKNKLLDTAKPIILKMIKMMLLYYNEIDRHINIILSTDNKKAVTEPSDLTNELNFIQKNELLTYHRFTDHDGKSLYEQFTNP